MTLKMAAIKLGTSLVSSNSFLEFPIHIKQHHKP